MPPKRARQKRADESAEHKLPVLQLQWMSCAGPLELEVKEAVSSCWAHESRSVQVRHQT